MNLTRLTNTTVNEDHVILRAVDFIELGEGFEVPNGNEFTGFVHDFNTPINDNILY